MVTDACQSHLNDEKVDTASPTTHLGALKELVLSRKSLRDEDLEELWLASDDCDTLPTTNPLLVPSLVGLPVVSKWTSLQVLDLSRNLLLTLPVAVCTTCRALETLNVSRNSLRGLPSEIGLLTQLRELLALSNNLRLAKLPLEEFATLTHLESLDLRYNSKLKAPALAKIQQHLGAAAGLVDITTAADRPKSDTPKFSACDRDATLLRSQLEPLSTPTLARRLEEFFGVTFNKNNEDMFDRDLVMQRLLACYHNSYPQGRTVSLYQGLLVDAETCQDLLSNLKALTWPQNRERPKIAAQRYMILQKQVEGNPDNKRAKGERKKLLKYQNIWDAVVALLQTHAPDFCKRFTALAVTMNFTGSPHIDTLNVGPFFAMSLGDFEGGNIAVEVSADTVAQVDTRNRLACVDGRRPHWVTPYTSCTTTDTTTGAGGVCPRYSLIAYATYGPVVPQTTAVLEPTHPVDM
jgi:Leucine-rich repeat (LRR) protein